MFSPCFFWTCYLLRRLYIYFIIYTGNIYSKFTNTYKTFYGKLCPFNPFHANGLLYLYPLKTLENLFEELKRHSVKSVEMGSFFWSVFSRIQSEYGKIRTRKNSEFRHFSHSETIARNGLLRNYLITLRLFHKV